MKIFTRFVIFLIFLSPFAKAQDWHYSQFYYSPLTLNPALTGDMNGTYRVGLNYRNQWSAITSPFVYSTPSVWGDITVFRGKFSGNSLGMGIMILDDKQGDAPISTFSLMYSVAYHQTIDAAGNFHISAGLQGGLFQRSIDQTKLNFYNQFDGAGFNSDLPSGEKIVPNYSQADFAAGFAVDGLISDYSKITFGFAAFHLTQPNESFENNLAADLYIRYDGHAQGTFGLGNRLYLFPAVMYQAQGPNSELVAGSAIGYNFAPSKRKVGTIFYIGGFDRVGDAIIVTTGFLLKGIQCGVSYDITTSSLQAANAGNGGFEIAIKYGNVVTQKKMKREYCPTF